MFKRALITGASSGIGSSLARLLSSKKISLILVGRDSKRLKAIGVEVGAEKVVLADLATKAGREIVVSQIREHHIDLLINNAGFGVYGEAVNLSIEEQLAILEVNGSALLELSLAFAKERIAKNERGTILNVSSAAGEYPTPLMAVYGATKSFVTSLSLALNYELSSRGVKVLVACPGMVATHFQSCAAKKEVTLSGQQVMDPDFAAEQIWWQIEQQKEKHVFNWRYRLGSMVAKYLLPSSWVKRLIWKQIKKRL